MALKIETGFNLQIAIGAVVIGCAQTVKFGSSREVKDATCAASAGVKESVPGQKSYTMSADALMRVATGTDIPLNVTVKTLEEAFEAGTLLTFTFGTSTLGATKKTGTCYVQSLEQTGGSNDDAKFSVTFEVTGVVTYATNA